MSLEKPTSGKIFYNYEGQQKDITQFSKKELFEFRKKVQMVFQDPYSALNPMKRVYDSFHEPLKIHGFSNKDTREKMISNALEMVNICYVIHMNFQEDNGRDYVLLELWK